MSATVLYGQAVSWPAPAPGAGLRRFEIGGRWTDFTFGSANQTGVPKFALGPEVALNLNRSLALDASYSVMNLPSCAFAACSGGRQSVFLAGARAEASAKRYGLFAYGRPGVLRENAWTDTFYLISSPEPVTVASAGSSYFVSDVGGGFEYFVSSRTRANVELGDLLELETCAPCRTWTNHLQFSAGAYAMIGKPVAGNPHETDKERTHRFFDKTNLAFITVSLLGEASDAITTQRFHSQGQLESDPLARPFVDRGWGGQIGLEMIDNAAELSVMYALHRMHKHWVERAVPLVFGAAGGLGAYHNARTE